MFTQSLYKISLKHLFIDGKKQIGLKFFPNKVLIALTKEIKEIKWSDQFDMFYLANCKQNLDTIFHTFRGVAWVNGKYFFGNAGGFNEEMISLNDYKNRLPKEGIQYCPTSFYDTLEIKMYSFATAKSYIHYFEKFINHYYSIDYNHLTEQDIQSYLLMNQRQGISKNTLNLIINSIKFYYEVVLGMPNRFYAIHRPKKESKTSYCFGIKRNRRSYLGYRKYKTQVYY